MQILISGSSGLIGSNLKSVLSGEHEVKSLVRQRDMASQDRIFWDPVTGELNTSDLENFDVIIHLAGENIASCRWSAKQKQKILDSRVKATRLLADTLVKLDHPPKTLLVASAIGFYGDRGNETVQENSDAGSGFLADVCVDWEKATQGAKEDRIRVVNLRFGIVLSQKGGALRKMLPPFKFGLGGVLGSGKQFMSWISITDVVGAICHTIKNTSLEGPINIVAPTPLTNREFTKTLGKVLKRPTIFPLPAFVVNNIFGEMGKELLLSGAKVECKKLQESGYQFQHPQLEQALAHLLDKNCDQ